MLGVAGVDVLPSLLHAGDFGGVVELVDKGIGKIFGCGAREHASDVHVRVAGAGKAEVNDADDFIVLI